MKWIIAIIRPEQLAAVQGDGQEPGRTGIYRGTEVNVRWPNLRLAIAVDDWCVEGAVETILRAASSGDAKPLGDGKVLVVPLDGYLASALAHEPWWPSAAGGEDPWDA